MYITILTAWKPRRFQIWSESMTNSLVEHVRFKKNSFPTSKVIQCENCIMLKNTLYTKNIFSGLYYIQKFWNTDTRLLIWHTVYFQAPNSGPRCIPPHVYYPSSYSLSQGGGSHEEWLKISPVPLLWEGRTPPIPNGLGRDMTCWIPWTL